MRRFLPKLAFIILVASSYTVALAQEEHERELPARETAAQAKARRTAAAAKKLPADIGVTYEQVLADPDNIDLNYRYAQTQIAEGNLRGASATLERILLNRPDLAQVRLLYGVVLFRLDNLDESERTLRAVRDLPIAPSLRDEVDDYLNQIKLRRKRTRFNASLALGYQYDNNRNAAPRTEQRMIGDTPAQATGDARRRQDTSVIAIQSVGVTHDLGWQAGHQIFANFNHYQAEQTYVDDLDLESYSGQLGAILRAGTATVVPSLITDQIYLSREMFVRAHGGDITVEQPMTTKLGLFGNARAVWEDYDAISENHAAAEREGQRKDFSVGANYALAPRWRTSLIGSYTNKDAKAAYYDYDGLALQGNLTWLLPKGQFVTTSYTFGVNDYQDPDTAISAKTRRDEQHRARITYGAPVTLLTGRRLLPKWVTQDLNMTLTFEQFRSSSNIINYDYHNSKVNGMLTKSVEF